MGFLQNNGLQFYQFDIFPETIIQGVFTRHGGVSPEPWASLNVGGMVGDESGRVQENRRRMFEALKRNPDSMFDVWLVHSAEAVCADAPRAPDQVPSQADIILTDQPAVTLVMRYADCVPIFLHDPRQGVIGLVHAGWLGTIRGAASAAIERMQSRYGSKPADIRAAIGPSIGPDHYEIGLDVIAQIKKTFAGNEDTLLRSHSGHVYFDLWKANQFQLNEKGVEQVEQAGICTACHVEAWYSHRAERGRTGRFGALMALRT